MEPKKSQQSGQSSDPCILIDDDSDLTKVEDILISSGEKKAKEAEEDTLEALSKQLGSLDLVSDSSDDISRTLLEEARKEVSMPQDTFTGIFVAIDNIELSHHNLRRLITGEWLDDLVINCYMKYLNNLVEGKDVFCWNSYFYTSLTSHSDADRGYQKVTRWIKKMNLFEFKQICIPINLPGHWVLAVINNESKRIIILDSMESQLSSSRHDKIIMNMKYYLKREFENKYNTKSGIPNYMGDNPCSKTPQQSNGDDCGVFLCHFAEYIVLNNGEIPNSSNGLSAANREKIFSQLLRSGITLQYRRNLQSKTIEKSQLPHGTKKVRADSVLNFLAKKVSDAMIGANEQNGERLLLAQGDNRLH